MDSAMTNGTALFVDPVTGGDELTPMPMVVDEEAAAASAAAATEEANMTRREMLELGVQAMLEDWRYQVRRLN